MNDDRTQQNASREDIRPMVDDLRITHAPAAMKAAMARILSETRKDIANIRLRLHTRDIEQAHARELQRTRWGHHSWGRDGRISHDGYDRD
jgi:hypothetical protein